MPRVTHLAPGHEVPDFTLKNTSGGPVTLSEYMKGGPVLLAFYKHECPTCQLGIPFVEQVYRRSRGGPIRFLGVMEDEKADAVAFAKKHAIMMPFVLEDEPYATSEAFGLTNVPTLLLLDANRKVQWEQVGFSKKGYQELADKVAALCGKDPEPLFNSMMSVPDLKPG